MKSFKSSEKNASKKQMKFDEPGEYRLRIVMYKKFREIYLPVISLDEETGQFETKKKAFTFRDPDMGYQNNIFSRIAKAEFPKLKEIYGEESKESKTSSVLPRLRFRFAGFDLTGREGTDPNSLATFDFGVNLQKELEKLEWGTKKEPGKETILNYGPLFGYDIILTREGKGKATKWKADPVSKLSPWEDQLTTELHDDEKFDAWFDSLDLSKYFTPEQLKSLNSIEEILDKPLIDSYMTDEEVIETLSQTPLDLSFVEEENNKPLFIPQILPIITDKLTSEIKKLKLSPPTPVFLLEAPTNESTPEIVVQEKPEAPQQELKKDKEVAQQPVAPSKSNTETTNPDALEDW